MPRWNRVLLLTATLAIGAVCLPARAADDETTRALATLKTVTKEGKGNEDAGPAWKTLVSKGVAALLPTLEAFDENNQTATNWLRAAVDAIAENEIAAGRKLPVDKLEAFLKDTTFAPSARRAAYELLVSQDATAKDRLLPNFLNDKSPDLRRDAIARELAILEKAAGPTIKADLAKLFTFTRDKDQVDLLAKKLEENGGKASVSEHFGFVTHAALVGPFDNTDRKGFDVAYPPESAKDTSGAFMGKNEEVKWGFSSTKDKYGQLDLNKLIAKPADAPRYRQVVAYALAVIVADKDMPCDIRVTSITATKIFLNGTRVFARDEYHHGSPFDGMIGKGSLKKGENLIVLKVCQNNQDEDWARKWFFQLRVCDETGGPLPLKQKISADGKDTLIPLGFIPEMPKEEKK
jgi:hypothetical protein